MNWKKHSNIWLAVCLLLAVLAGQAGAVTHYVFEGQSIQAAIDDPCTVNGDEIEVAPGTYTEAIDFKGKAVRLYSSDGPGVTTINGNGVYHVVQCISGETANTILEGFTITGGNANGIWPNERGGGMYNDNSSPTVTNCVFTGNTTTGYGGGMSNNASEPTVTGCTFEGNSSANHFGGMHNDWSSPTISNCRFTANSANGMGGGIGSSNYCSGTVTDCTFSDNTAADSGGGMYNAESSPTLTNCTFTGNTADLFGGGMYNEASSNPTVTNCTFSGNTADSGGGMCNYWYSSPTITGCTFTGNTATNDGGGIYNDYSSPMLTNCEFLGNEASWGGGMYNETSSNPTVTNCTFSGNLAVAAGGGMCTYQSSPTVTNCNFSNNSADNYGGGGMGNSNSSPMVTNCTFSGNVASFGGGMENFKSSPTVTNCTFSGNSAGFGGGMVNNNNSSTTVTNCIFWGNSTDEIHDGGTSSTTVNYSDVEDGWGDPNDPNNTNINGDPCFVDATAGDFRLGFGSPCIDAGNNTAVPSSVLKDLAGKLRFADDPCTPDTGDAGMTGRPVVDIGAYEFQGGASTRQNLLANPGFEVGDATGWVTNWGFSLTADTNQVHDGNYSGLASGRTASWQGAWQSLLGLMDDGKTYRVSGWVRLENATSDYVALTVKKVDSTGDHYYGIDNATAYSDKWVNLDGTLNFDANESMTDLYVYFEGPAPDVNFYVDDAAVTEVMGDMNHNGGVDFIDFSLFASYYGFDCSTQDCGRANLDDSDNTINERDLAILCNNWLAGTEP